MKTTRRSIGTSIIALLLCFAMLLGTTFAWFTDLVVSGNNIVQSGSLDVEMYWSDKLLAADSNEWQNADGVPIFTYDKWEPGYTEVKYVKVKNAGNLALQWRLNIEAEGEVTELADVIDVYYVNPVSSTVTTLEGKTSAGVLSDVIASRKYTSGVLLPAGEVSSEYTVGETILAIAFHMDKDAGNEYQGKSIGDGFSVNLMATQWSFENDAFGDGYDNEPEWPNNVIVGGNSASANVNTDASNKVAGAVALNSADGKLAADIPVGVQLKDGVSKVTLSVSDVADAKANVTLSETEATLSIDVHIEGVAEDNDVVMSITIKELLPVGLNMGNHRFYHVEDGATVEMTLLADGATPVHNNYEYDPATGDVVLYLKSFSEFAVVADNENPWVGEYDDSWYNADAENLVIANADQLAAFSAIVGGMKFTVGETEKQYDADSFAGQTIKLLADVNLGDKESENNPDIIFYPIGYWNNEGTYERKPVEDRTTAVESGFYTFEGTFDGNGHTIENFYQNTWEMKGDHDWYDPIKEQYYRDGMGLFGKVYGGTVKNLTVKNFSSDGEIATTGVIAAYADGATFENIAIFDCNPRVYNIGNGGIVGCVGWYAKEADLKTTFTNITVDNSNKISALWGSYDVACGGIVGQYYPTSGQSSAGTPKNAGVEFVNCHISAQMDVYNDVCANYQYYAYRYTGMLIGSVRENVTIDGHVYPKMDGITAEGCTVHFGTWNDYYYCEIIDNTTASYTHDYQMSRLEQVKAVDVENMKVTSLKDVTTDIPTSGRYNYVVVNGEHATENATCYHFKDGEVWNHEDAGYHNGANGEKYIDENNDGEPDLKEDKQHIYLEFNNLVTGYGWGVTTKGVDDLTGVTILDREVADSVEKFEDADVEELPNGIAISVGDLFNAIANTGVEIKPGALMVSVEALDEGGNITATFNRDVNNWENSTITITGTGNARITIQDYYFCKATSIEVNVVEASNYDAFDLVFNNTNDYIYRVGNQNAVALGSLFSAELNKTVTANEATITVEKVAGDATGVYTVNGTDWATGTIKFTGMGVVTVTVKLGGTKELTLNLEVVNATNVTKYSELKDQNSVLLADITMSSGGTYRLTGNKVLYGNGFTFDVKNGAYAGVDYDYASYVIYLENSRLDNVKIEGAVYPEVGATKADNYNRAIVMTGGDCSIINSFISNGASPIRNGGNLELVNTTLKGGAYANLDLRNGHLILDNVTTINQANANDKYNGEKVVVGMGIVVYQEGGSDTLKITIRNGLTQYNYLSETEANTYFTDTYSKAVKNVVFGSDLAAYQNNGLINFGIVSMNSYVAAEDVVDERSDKTGYFGTPHTVTVLGNSRNCYVYSFKPESTTPPTYSGYKTIGQGVIAPTVEFDFDINYVAKTEESNDYCYTEGNTVYISMDDGDSFDWDTSILTASKCGETLKYTVTVNGVDYTGKSISFNVSDECEVIYTYTDSYNYTLEDGTVESFEKSYTQTVKIIVSVVKATAKNAEFSFGANGTAYAGKTVLIGDKTYVMPDVTATVSGKIGSTTVNGTTVYYPITEMYTSDGKTAHTGSWYACFPIFKDAVQIIDYADQGTGDSVTYNQEKVTTVAGIPSTLKATNPTSAFLYSMNATNYPPPTDPTAVSDAVCYTCNRNGLTASNTRTEMTIIAEYTYTDNAGKVYYYYVGYHCAEQTKGSSPCVTPDTLVTLADGTQKRIDQVTYEDQLLVWDFYKGEYAVVPAAIIFDHGYGDNTVIKLDFGNGASVKVVNMHQFFDATLNKMVTINADNVEQYVGHEFVRQDGDGYSTVTLDAYTITEEYVEAWGVMSALHYNIIVEGIFSADFDPADLGLFNYFEIGEDMKYDEAAMQADIEKYGLYTYEDFADYLTYEQFVAFNVQYFKISVEKGNYTFEGILALIDEYLNK